MNRIRQPRVAEIVASRLRDDILPSQESLFGQFGQFGVRHQRPCQWGG